MVTNRITPNAEFFRDLTVIHVVIDQRQRSTLTEAESSCPLQLLRRLAVGKTGTGSQRTCGQLQAKGSQPERLQGIPEGDSASESIAQQLRRSAR